MAPGTVLVKLHILYRLRERDSMHFRADLRLRGQTMGTIVLAIDPPTKDRMIPG